MNADAQDRMTGLEALAVLVGLAVFIGIIALETAPTEPFLDKNKAYGLVFAGATFAQVYLVMACLMPSWGVAGLEGMRRPLWAERYAAWASTWHPLAEQRLKCTLQAARLAQNRQDLAAAACHAELGLALAGRGLERPELSLSYAHCLSIRAAFARSEHRLQEALEDYGRAIRLVLPKYASSAGCYAYASGILYEMGRFEEALVFAQQVTETAAAKPATRAMAHRAAALSLAEQGRWAEAVAEGRAGLATSTFSWASLMLSVDQFWLLTMAGEVEEAAELQATLQAMLQEKDVARLIASEYREVMARIALARKDWAEAERLLREGLVSAEADAAACYYLRMLALRRGDAAEAEAWRERLWARSPESFYVRRITDEAAGVY